MSATIVTTRTTSTAKAKQYTVWCKSLPMLYSFVCRIWLHTYIISHYNLSGRITTYLLTLLILCVLIADVYGVTFSLKFTPKTRSFELLFMAILFYTQGFCQQTAESKLTMKYFYHIYVLMWILNRRYHRSISANDDDKEEVDNQLLLLA